MATRLKLLLINNTEEFEMISSKGFKYSRACGNGAKGLSIAAVVNYIDNLIIAQRTLANNFKFIEKK